jgi:CRISPR-associated protein Csm1
VTPGDYLVLWEAFQSEFEDLRKRNLHTNVDIVLHLLEKYLSSIPATTLRITGEESQGDYHKHPDISLFDHVKISAAVAHCLHDYYSMKHADGWTNRVLVDEITGRSTWKSDAEEPFLLVGGDLSGVQDFIHTISSKGAIKSLKGRSFFLEIFTEHLVATLLTVLGLARCQVIFTGGGHFYLIAPNVPSAIDGIEEIKRQADEYLWQSFNGRLEQFIEVEPFNKSDLRNIRKPWQRLSGKLQDAKQRRWSLRLREVLAEPNSPHLDCLTAQCEVCGREDLALSLEQQQPAMCSHCKDQWELGSRLQSVLRESEKMKRAPVVAVWAQAPTDGGWALPIGTGSYRRHYRPVSDVQTFCGHLMYAYHVNCWDFRQFGLNESRPFLASTYHESSFYDVEKLVQDGFGMQRVAILRMDVDNLGRIFSQPFLTGRDTLAMKAALSRQLSLFFKYHIDGILRDEQERYRELPRADLAGRGRQPRKVGVIYSGGDDLFILGHWLDVLEAGVDIREAFARFTANPAVTASAGFVFAHPHYPAYRLAEQAGRAEQDAKRSAGGEKNSLGFGAVGNVFSWDTVTEGLPEVLRLIRPFMEVKKAERLSLTEGGLSAGFLYRLLQLARNHKRLGGWQFPKMAWLFGRHKPRDEPRFGKNWQALTNYIFQHSVNWACLEAAVLLALMMMQKEETHERTTPDRTQEESRG